jgi:WD40 repeat protein/predicted Ser/Thr protein kinase
MTGVCPDCGTPLPKEAALLGLCPQCLLSMALEDDDLPTLHGSSPGGILGERYQIREVLGRGGMGEVYRAFDLKLRVDVALKAVRPELSASEKARELLRQEVRSAREVVSPNVCRIFDLVVEEGRELVSMEYIDGTTLAETLRERGPLELQEAREIAAQFLSGLEAIHEAGLVHRDFKPENVMLTRAGRVVVMDFGLAKALSEAKSRSVAGTPAYMSPEQSRGEGVDARSDVFSAGVVLSEMLWGGARQEVWEAARESPPRVPEGPWARVLRQALSSDRESRYPTARALARALDEETHRLPGFEAKHPYPGLASFTQEDAEYFFGREVEVEAVWKKLKRPRLLALIGPSGAGKSSFLSAGILPTVPPGWRVALSTPGHHPLQGLAEALLPAFAGDMESIQSFLRFHEPETALALFSAWRQKSEHALVIVDQFEELFTLNPPEVREAFANLLGRLVLEADVHVLLSLRDDFLFHCQKHDALSPVFSELTPLGTLSPSALRRALVQPALACGYRFEDDALVEEMVSEVSRERGVLPLLAFAASRLWEKRDREQGLLTREAYREIGGVEGALAQHAEETLERIRPERTPLVRELFRNLVTAQGTRASREVEELLSIFSNDEERRAAEEVLRELVAARLLTAYETSVEIIHESLLSAWPRLVQWRNQDEGGALLRDQLRQAAQAWRERGRRDDLLWTGSSYRELALWRERYTGGLSSTEEAFAQAAAKLAGRRRRRRRIAVASAFAALLVIMAVVLASRQQAIASARRTEAAQLLSIGRLHLESYPTAALAYATASLERADNAAARRFAVEALWTGPPARYISAGSVAESVRFSPDGRWLATDGRGGAWLFPQDGGPPHQFPNEWCKGFSGDGHFLVTQEINGATFHVRGIPDGNQVRSFDLEEDLYVWVYGDELIAASGRGRSRHVVRRGPLTGGEILPIGELAGDFQDLDVDDSGRWLAEVRRDGEILFHSLEALGSPPRSERQPGVVSVWPAPRHRIATAEASGEVRIWNPDEGDAPERILRAPAEAEASVDDFFTTVGFSPSGRWAAVTTAKRAQRWELSGPPDAQPIDLSESLEPGRLGRATLTESWAAFPKGDYAVLWPLPVLRAVVLRAPAGQRVDKLAFTSDGRTLLSSDPGSKEVKLWPLSPEAEARRREYAVPKGRGFAFDADPEGRFFVIDGQRGVAMVPLAGGASRWFQGDGIVYFARLDRKGRRIAAYTDSEARKIAHVYVWDIETGHTTDLFDPRAIDGDCAEGNRMRGMIWGMEFLADGTLLTDGFGGLRVWDLVSETNKVLRACDPASFRGEQNVWHSFTLSRDGRLGVRVLAWTDPTAPSVVTVVDLAGGNDRAIVSHGNRVWKAALDPTGRILVTGDKDGLVGVGPVTGEEPHLLFGHTGRVNDIAVSPDGKWIASASTDGTIRLWPMPEGPPLHTLPYETLLQKLHELTNLRVAADPASETGYKLEIGPFPGWAKVPKW